MRAILRNITLAVASFLLVAIGNHSASAQDLTCHDGPQWDNFVLCGTCAPCPAGPSTAQLALHSADQATTAVQNLAGQLKRANGALASLRSDTRTNSATIIAIEARVAQLETKMKFSCASITDTASAQACWNLMDKATGGTNQSALAVFGNALNSGVPFNGTVAVGSTSITPGFYAKFETSDTTPAFAQVRKDRVAPASEYDNGLWPYFVVPAVTTLSGALIGYGYGDDSRTSTNAGGGTSFWEGNKAETAAIGAGIGLGTGLVFDAVYYLITKPDPAAVR